MTALKNQDHKVVNSKDPIATVKPSLPSREKTPTISPAQLVSLRERLLNKVYRSTSVDPEVEKYGESTYSPEYELNSLNGGRLRARLPNYIHLSAPAEIYPRSSRDSFPNSPSDYLPNSSPFAIHLRQPRPRLHQILQQDPEEMGDRALQLEVGRYLHPRLFDSEDENAEVSIPQMTHRRFHYSPLTSQQSILDGLEEQKKPHRFTSRFHFREPESFEQNEEVEAKSFDRFGDRISSRHHPSQRYDKFAHSNRKGIICFINLTYICSLLIVSLSKQTGFTSYYHFQWHQCG